MKDTPMMRQYNGFKKQYPDKILLFRMGDFYETFGEDAVRASKILNITLTTRDKNSDPTPLAGFPHHSLEQYLAKIVDFGVCAVVVDQIEDPKQAVGIVKRGVTRVVTPGTLSGELATENKNPYLLSFSIVKEILGIAYCDISTGELTIGELPYSHASVKSIMNSVDPSEVVLSFSEEKFDFDTVQVQLVDEKYPKTDRRTQYITDFYNVQSLESLGIETLDASLTALYFVLSYIEETQKMIPDHISRPVLQSFDDQMVLDSSTIRNLDLIENSYTRSRSESLIEALDSTKTPMGKRKLYHWILNPLRELSAIHKRLLLVSSLNEDSELLSGISNKLSSVSDIDRIIGKIGLNSANARDLKSLQVSLESVLEVLSLIESKETITNSLDFGETPLKSLLESAKYVVSNIDSTISENPPLNISDGGIIKSGVSTEIDELRGLTGTSKSWVKELEETERTKYKIPSLKVGFNRVFGYYIEVTKTHVDKVPPEYIRKQTLVNSERYITDELKKKEEIILNAEEKMARLEYEEFQELRNHLVTHLEKLRALSFGISDLDILSGFAEIARYHSYVEPQISDFGVDGGLLEIKNGRHPVVERLVEGEFISNDTVISIAKNRMGIITGPNMAGKSTYIRQVALIVLMGQIGSFVPAKSAKFSLVDRVFSRVGASDNLAQGRSTFMVEMEEAANILNNASEHSLVILDEVGRGTSTYDGVSIAWALVEYLVNSIKARTLFATHYHELTSLETEHPDLVQNLNVDVKEDGDEVVFLRKIVTGGTDKSYGIYVAEMAGLPAEVITRANEIMGGLDINLIQQSNDSQTSFEPTKKAREVVQFKLFDAEEAQVVAKLHGIDIENMTPLDALKLLSELKDEFGNK